MNEPSRLPNILPNSELKNISGIIDPLQNEDVLIWGSLRNEYHNGIITAASGNNSWPHGKYGTTKYDFQFPIMVEQDTALSVGDSGGIILNKQGNIVGLLAAISSPTEGLNHKIAHGVPIKKSLEALALRLAI